MAAGVFTRQVESTEENQAYHSFKHDIGFAVFGRVHDAGTVD